MCNVLSDRHVFIKLYLYQMAFFLIRNLQFICITTECRTTVRLNMCNRVRWEGKNKQGRRICRMDVWIWMFGCSVITSCVCNQAILHHKAEIFITIFSNSETLLKLRVMCWRHFNQKASECRLVDTVGIWCDCRHKSYQSDDTHFMTELTDLKDFSHVCVLWIRPHLTLSRWLSCCR